MVLNYFQKNWVSENLFNEWLFFRLDMIVRKWDTSEAKEIIKDNLEEIFTNESLKTLKKLIEEDKVSINLLWAIFYVKFLEDKSIEETTKTRLKDIFWADIDNEKILEFLEYYKKASEEKDREIARLKTTNSNLLGELQSKDKLIRDLSKKNSKLEEFKRRYIKLQTAFVEAWYSSENVFFGMLQIIRDYPRLLDFLKKWGIIFKTDSWYKVVSAFKTYIESLKTLVKVSRLENDSKLWYEVSWNNLLKQEEIDMVNYYDLPKMYEDSNEVKKWPSFEEMDIVWDAMVEVAEIGEMLTETEKELVNSRLKNKELEADLELANKNLDRANKQLEKKDEEIERLKKELERYKKIAEPTISLAINTYKENN